MLFVAMATVGAVILIGCSEIVEPPEEPPTAVLTGAPTGTNDITALAVTVSGDRVTRYRHKVTEGTVCTADGYGPSTPVGTVIRDDISALADGPITLCVLGATDSGLWQTDPTTASWVKDMPEPHEEPPVAVLTGAPTGTNDITALAVTVSGDRVTRYRHKVTEGTACTADGYGPSTPVGTVIRDDISALEDGPITLCVLGETDSGLWQTDPTTASWVKKTPEPPEEPPVAVLTGAPTGTNDTVVLAVTVSGDRVTRYRHKVTEGAVCTADGYGPSTPVGTVIRDDISALEDGPITLCVLGETDTGLRQTDPTKASWVKDMPPIVKRGKFSVPGVNQIPLDMMKLANSEMRKMFVTTEHDILLHGQAVRKAACGSYTVQCENPESRFGKTRDTEGITYHTGTAPYTSLSDLAGDTTSIRGDWIHAEILDMRTAKIVTFSISPGGGSAIIHGSTIPFLQIQGAGNVDSSGMKFHSPEDIGRTKIPETIAEDKLLLIAGWNRDKDGHYTHHPGSLGCKHIDEGCLWAQFRFSGLGEGTSFSGPNVGSGLASVLSVFPDTTHQNLANLAKACARKTGDGIEKLLRESGGIGVADFSCMGPITDAARNLPTGGSATVRIDGKTVTVTERELVVR